MVEEKFITIEGALYQKEFDVGGETVIAALALVMYTPDEHNTDLGWMITFVRFRDSVPVCTMDISELTAHQRNVYTSYVSECRYDR